MVQRFAPAERIAAQDSQRWLAHMNRSGYDIYISMNALAENARDRTKESVAAIRHVYLDLDDGGDEALRRLLARKDLPKPNYVLHTSPGKHQVVWKVEGFSQEQAEALQRSLSREAGADVAVTDSSRVLRLPGFYNRKYGEPHLVEARKLSEQTYRPEHFPAPREADREADIESRRLGAVSARMRSPERRISQSERDWAYARRALSRGESRDTVVAAIASYRRFNKYNPTRYAERTVDKAILSIKAEMHHRTVDQPSPQR